MFKVGDTVRCKESSLWGTEGSANGKRCDVWGGDMVVTRILPDGWIMALGNCATAGAFSPDTLELVDVNKSLSDQELADKYRALRQEATAIAQELVKRGYGHEIKSNGDYSWAKISASVTTQYRFIKTETKETIL